LEELNCSLTRLLHNCAVCSSKASFIACIYTIVIIIERKLISGYLKYSFFIGLFILAKTSPLTDCRLPIWNNSCIWMLASTI